MTPYEIVESYLNGNLSQCRELETEDLWAFLETRPYTLMQDITPAYRALQIYSDLMLSVVATVRIERDYLKSRQLAYLGAVNERIIRQLVNDVQRGETNASEKLITYMMTGMMDEDEE